MAIPSILRQLKKADYLYVFLPGNLSTLVSICAIVLKKSYGVYLRGELGIDTKLTRLILSNGDFVHANGHVLADKAHRFCSDVELTIPMLDLTDQDCVTRKNFKRQPPWNLLYVGRVEIRKGIYELIKAARILKEQNINFKLNIVGEGPELKKVKTESTEELRENLRFLGLISDRDKLFSLYMNADLFVLPSHEEGFPRVLYEAMAFQTPIITSFVGSISSVMEHEVNCLRDLSPQCRFSFVISSQI
jgi:glycosyltransferase involved in cell wall biosynthesis